MERKTLKHTIKCEGDKTVEIKYVYNYVYEEYNELLGRAKGLGGITQEIHDLKKENQVYISDAGSAIVDKSVKFLERRKIVAELLKKKAANEEKIENLLEDIKAINDLFKVKNLFPLIKGILEDNKVEDKELLTASFWDRKTEHNEGWLFIVACINKDAEQAKKKAE